MPLKIYRQKADSPNFWEKHWEKFLKGNSLKNHYQSSENSPILQEIFERYLPKRGKILEAGCGLGTLVYLLRQKGYNVEGVDFAKETINFIKSKFPELPVKIGNVFNLDYPDNSFKGYISWGVVEHFEEGPEKILREMARILDKNGIVILSVPYFNPFRKLKKIFGFYRNQKGDFYEYLFTRDEIVRYIKEAGFRIIKTYPYNTVKGLRDEVLGMKQLHGFVIEQKNNPEKVFKKSNNCSQFLLKKIINSFLMRFLFAHMVIIIAKKI